MPTAEGAAFTGGHLAPLLQFHLPRLEGLSHTQGLVSCPWDGRRGLVGA